MESIGERICNRRKELGLTQQDLADRLGYKSKSSINKIEIGKNDLPQKKIIEIARALNTTPRYLMGWEDEAVQNSSIIPLISIMREDGTFVNLVEEFAMKKDKLQPLVFRMCTDDEFLSIVWDFANLDDVQLRSIRQLLSAFKQK